MASTRRVYIPYPFGTIIKWSHENMTGFSTLKMVAKCKKQSNGNSILQYVSKKKKKKKKTTKKVIIVTIKIK